MSKKNICRNCKAEMPKGTRVCPSCGARNKKPFYQRGWFIILAVLIVFFIIGSIGDKKEEYETKKEQESSEYRWPDNELAMMISQPESKLGKVQLESEESFMIDIYKVSYNQYEDYVVDCKGKGFTVDYSKTDNLFTAENEDGFSLMVAYSEEDEMMDITLDRPREITSEEETEEVGEEKSEISTEDSQNEETKAVEEVEKENKDEKAESDFPGVMASRTIENERDRRMTIMTTTFVPCSAKMPIVGLIAAALFGKAPRDSAAWKKV